MSALQVQILSHREATLCPAYVILSYCFAHASQSCSALVLTSWSDEHHAQEEVFPEEDEDLHRTTTSRSLNRRLASTIPRFCA